MCQYTLKKSHTARICRCQNNWFNTWVFFKNTLYLKWFHIFYHYVVNWPRCVWHHMMTSSNGNITGPLWRESTGDRWIPLTKASDAELWCFLWSAPEHTVEQTIEAPMSWDCIYMTIIPRWSEMLPNSKNCPHDSLFVLLTISRHWFRQWLGAIKHRAIILTNDDPAQWRIHVTSFNELTELYSRLLLNITVV